MGKFQKGHKPFGRALGGFTNSEETRKRIKEAIRIKYPNGRKLSEETKQKMSKGQKLIGNKPPITRRFGKNNNWWKGGITKPRKNYYNFHKEKLAGRKKPKKCEICGFSGKICFDHCHRTNKFRGWICLNCNMALGFVRDNPKILKKLAKYLIKHNAPNTSQIKKTNR